MQETGVRSLSQEDAVEKEMATPSSILGLENPMDRGAWWATVRGVTKLNMTEQLARARTHTHTHTHKTLKQEYLPQYSHNILYLLLC